MCLGGNQARWYFLPVVSFKIVLSVSLVRVGAFGEDLATSFGLMGYRGGV